jgi:hypothetical protein
MWIISKSHLDIFAILSSSRHENRCQMLERIFAYFNALETHSAVWRALRAVIINGRDDRWLGVVWVVYHNLLAR